MHQVLTLFLSTFSTLLAIINPLEALPVFINLLKGKSSEQHRNIARRSCIYAALLMFFFFVFGAFILRVFGVSLSMVRVVGGIVLLRIGFQLFAGSSPGGPSPATEANGEKSDIAFMPLAMPIMFGPGAIATIVGMTSLVRDSELELASFLAIAVAILATMLVTYLCLAYAEKVIDRVGPTGIDAVTRIVGFFVATMGGGLVFHGVIEALQESGVRSSNLGTIQTGNINHLISRALALVCGATLLGCASRPHNVFLVSPVQSGSRAEIVDMLVTTDRKSTPAPGVLFGGERGDLSFAEISISIPPKPAHKAGYIEWPKRIPANPAREFSTVGAKIIDKSEIVAALHQRVLAQPQRSVLVFVHGYNNRFDDAVFRFAQIVHDSGTQDVPVLFAWPSGGELLDYGYDRDSATYSRDTFEKVLDYLVNDPSISEISILAHSMGNWLTLETLRQQSIRSGGIPKKIKNVMLASADVDIDVFEKQVEAMGKNRPEFTVFVAADDRALAVSRILWRSKKRLGEINPDTEPFQTFVAHNHLDVINLTDVRTHGDIHHDKFAQSPVVVRLIGRQLATGQPITDHEVSIGDTIGLAATGLSLRTGTVINAATAADP